MNEVEGRCTDELMWLVTFSETMSAKKGVKGLYNGRLPRRSLTDSVANTHLACVERRSETKSHRQSRTVSAHSL